MPDFIIKTQTFLSPKIFYMMIHLQHLWSVQIWRIMLSGVSRLIFCLMMLSIGMSCQKDDPAPAPESDKFRIQVNQRIDQGNLLNEWAKTEEGFVLYFEKDTMEIPIRSLADIKDQPEKWETTLIFTDLTEMAVPSRGGDLDFILKDLVINPSGHNPLSAKIDLHLPARGRVKIVVRGKEGESGTIRHLFRDQTPRQHLPVLGLYADHENHVDIVFTDFEGNERGRTSIIVPVGPLILPDFPVFEIAVAQKERMEPGLNLVSYPGQSEIDTSRPYMVDENGDIRWILLFKDSPELAHFAQSIGLKRTKKGTYISGDMSEDRIIEVDVLGNLLNEWSLKSMGYSFHHEVTEAENGNFLITVTKDDARLANGKPRINDFMIELHPGTSSVLREWDLAQMLDTSRYEKPDDVTPEDFVQTPGNWAHNNSITPFGDHLLATLRYQGMFCFSPAGNVQWILSPHHGWSEPFESYLLYPLDKNGVPITDEEVISGKKSHPDFEWLWGPHTPVALPNGNVLVFDNGYDRNFISNTLSQEENYSRVVEYKIDPRAKTVQQVWAYGKERGRETFAQALSGVQYLPRTGHVLFCPGMGTMTGRGFGGHVIEVDPVTDEVIFELRITSSSYTAFHRVTRMPLYPPEL